MIPKLDLSKYVDDISMRYHWLPYGLQNCNDRDCLSRFCNTGVFEYKGICYRSVPMYLRELLKSRIIHPSIFCNNILVHRKDKNYPDDYKEFNSRYSYEDYYILRGFDEESSKSLYGEFFNFIEISKLIDKGNRYLRVCIHGADDVDMSWAVSIPIDYKPTTMFSKERECFILNNEQNCSDIIDSYCSYVLKYLDSPNLYNFNINLFDSYLRQRNILRE